MADETFAVGCSGVAFHGGVVFLDLVGLSHTQRDADGRPARELRQRIVMTAEGMLETYQAITGIISKLEEAGVIKRKEADKQLS